MALIHKKVLSLTAETIKASKLLDIQMQYGLAVIWYETGEIKFKLDPVGTGFEPPTDYTYFKTIEQNGLVYHYYVNTN